MAQVWSGTNRLAVGRVHHRTRPEANARQDARSLCIAIVVHLLVAGLLEVFAADPAQREAVQSATGCAETVVEISVELTSGGSQFPPPPGSHRSSEALSGSSLLRLGSINPPAAAVPSDGNVPEGAGELPPEAGSTGQGTAPWSSPTTGDTGGYGPPPLVGLTPGPGWGAGSSLPGVLLPDYAPPAPTSVPRRRYDRDAAGRVLRSELRQRDARLGLLPPAAAATASALRVAVRGHAPDISRGTFQARFNSRGRLVDLRVLSFSTGTIQQWRRAVVQARAELVGQTFAMHGHFASGALVTVNTRSVMQYPSGDGRKPARKRPTGPPSWPYTPKPPPHGRSFRTPPWGPPPDEALARGDLSDIGARKHRVVYATADAQPL